MIDPHRSGHTRLVRLPLAPLVAVGLLGLACGGAPSSDGGDESETGDGDGDGDDAPVLVERVLIGEIATADGTSMVAIEIGDPLAATVAVTFGGDFQRIVRPTPFGSYYLTPNVPITPDIVTEELRIDEQGYLTLEPFIPEGLPQVPWAVEFSPNAQTAIMALGVEAGVYQMRFDEAGQIVDAQELVQPSSPLDGDVVVSIWATTDAHALFSAVYAPWEEEPDSAEMQGLWLVELGVDPVLHEIELQPLESVSRFEALLLGDFVVHSDDEDQDEVIELRARPIADPDGPSTLIASDGRNPLASPYGARLVYLSGNGLYFVDLEHLEIDPALVSGTDIPITRQFLEGTGKGDLEPAAFVAPDRLVYVAAGPAGPIALMSVDIVDGVPQPAVRVSDELLDSVGTIDNWRFDPGRVIYAAADGGSGWLSWIDLSGPSIAAPVHLHDGLDDGHAHALWPTTGTRVPYYASVTGSMRLFSVDLDNPGAPLALDEGLPAGWQVMGGDTWDSSRRPKLIGDDQQIAFVVYSEDVTQQALARAPLDASAPVELLTESGGGIRILAELARP